MEIGDWIPFIIGQVIIFTLFFGVLRYHNHNLQKINDEWDKLQRRDKELTDRFDVLIERYRKVEIEYLKKQLGIQNEETGRGKGQTDL